MKRFFSFILFSLLLLTVPSIMAPCFAEDAVFPAIAEKVENITTTVQGFGKTSAEAGADARRQAQQISGGSYGNLGSTSRKVGDQWICELKISYRKK